ncbi:MAG: putative bifunctional diguanylate cyclase/phosphodiesterase [Gammaproteobacteria bacterium]
MAREGNSAISSSPGAVPAAGLLPDDLFDAAPVALLCLDEPGNVLLANRAVARLLGRSPAYMCHRPFITMVRQADRRRVVSHLTRLAQGEAAEIDVVLEMPHGTPLPVTVVSTPVIDEAGSLRYSQHALLDMSRRREMERTLQQTAARLDHLAHHDALTGLANRYLLEDRLARAVARCRRNGWLGALVFVDIDRFKLYNDTYGHAAGDAILVEAATRLSMAVREQDTVCRYSGDEFLVILENITSQADVDIVLGKLRDEFRRPVYGVADRTLVLSASFGATLFDRNTRDVGLLIKQADLAMYEVKQSRDDVVGYYSPQVNAGAERRRLLEAELGQALDGSQFGLQFQPQVDAASGRVRGCEALLRWHHPSRGRIEPGEFIPIAEHGGHIEQITGWALATACLTARHWLDRGIAFERISVNVSARDLSSPHLADQVELALRHAGLPPHMLEIEVTETSVMHHPEIAARTLRVLAEAGVKLALDDFGTGYSSLKCLKDHAFDRIKIDRSFVDALGHHAGNDAIVTAMISMASSLGVDVVAEGVEEPGQRARLLDAGVPLMQGFLFAPPLDADGAMRFMAGAAR